MMFLVVNQLSDEVAGSMRIIVVDDESEMLDYYRDSLDSFGFEIVYCSSPFSALNEIFKKPFDLIVTDLRMPLKSGLEMISFIREALDDRNIPVIVISGFIDHDVSKKLKDMPKVALIEKPVSQDLLKNTISTMLHSS